MVFNKMAAKPRWLPKMPRKHCYNTALDHHIKENEMSGMASPIFCESFRFQFDLHVNLEGQHMLITSWFQR